VRAAHEDQPGIEVDVCLLEREELAFGMPVYSAVPLRARSGRPAGGRHPTQEGGVGAEAHLPQGAGRRQCPDDRAQASSHALPTRRASSVLNAVWNAGKREVRLRSVATQSGECVRSEPFLWSSSAQHATRAAACTY
jgi:hypothetical protein